LGRQCAPYFCPVSRSELQLQSVYRMLHVYFL
jgi:hypothetical protein